MRNYKFYCYISSLSLSVLWHPPAHAQNYSAQQYAPWQGLENAQNQAGKQSDHATEAASAEAPLADADTTPSPIEEYYEKRTQSALKQFGYDLFIDQENSTQQRIPAGAVQDNYILSSGDQIFISFNGQRNDQKYYTIPADGGVFLKDLPPIYVHGLTIKQLREQLNALLNKQYNTNAYIALTAARQINILTIGHVNTPGRQAVSAFSNILDALSAAGGISKQGSLREIKLIRAGKTQTIDLYDLLLGHDHAIDTYLQDGDRLIVPPIGNTFAVTGSAKRPAIYELPYSITLKEESTTSYEALMALSGGPINTKSTQINIRRLSENGVEKFHDITNAESIIISDGAIIDFKKGTPHQRGKVELIGATTHPGFYDISRFKDLHTLLTHQDLFAVDIYPLIGAIIRTEKQSLSEQIITYPIRPVLEGVKNISLHDNDRIYLLKNTFITSAYNNSTETKNNNKKTTDTSDLSKKNNNDLKTLKKILEPYIVTIRGEVLHPGKYPVPENTPLQNLIEVAGGFTAKAERSNIEHTSAKPEGSHTDTSDNSYKRSIIDFNQNHANQTLTNPGDSVRVNQIDIKTLPRSVQVFGEVKRPGVYDIVTGDTLAALIERAGGLSIDAYPAGAVFSRKSERKAEEMRYKSTAQSLRQRLATAIEHDEKEPSSEQIALVNSLADQLATTETLGRISVVADPGMLDAHPEYDMLLEDGDKLYIPKRPMNVKVTGEVLSPANLPFREGKDAREYIDASGGFTYHADKERSFVLYPDGTAQPLSVSSWSYSDILIPPGSTIIVPRDPKPFDFLESAKEVGQILSNLAITAVFIDDIKD